MRVGSYAVGRPADYDRSSVTVPNSYNVTGVAPHGQTSRWSYTVPASTKARWLFAQLTLYRDTVTATPAGAAADLVLTPNGGSIKTIAYCYLLNGALSSFHDVPVSPNGYLFAGDVLASRTNDGSTGGTIGFTTSTVVNEFSA